VNALVSACHLDGTLSIHDRVKVDCRPGTVIGFYARENRTVLIRLDVGGALEVPESQVKLERVGRSEQVFARRVAARAAYNAMAL
jgi:hypothetical protein